MKLKFAIITIILLVFALGCAKPPLAEMESAREAVFRAENDSEAVLYGGSSLARARDALRRMQVEADSKRYDAAKTHAAEAIAAAEKAITDGKAGASRIRDEAAAMLSGLKPAIEETERNLNGARYSGLTLDYNELNKELNDARDTTDRAEIDQAMGRYQEALDKGKTARAAISDINEKLTSTVTSAFSKK